MNLPEDFSNYTKEIMGEELFHTLVNGLQEEPPVSIRLNPAVKEYKNPDHHTHTVGWCELGQYLPQRPNFTFDPLFHAGLYYVQEASSMFIYHIIQQLVKTPVRMLDLCAAPGGKSTCCISALPTGSTLYCNEPIRNRAQILSENIQKWLMCGILGKKSHSTDHLQKDIDIKVTNNYPRDYKKAKATFDIILADVPCSGEGMFRKDEGAVAEWSIYNVGKCRDLQQDIISTIWPCLRPGGILIYSTCTFNTKENEENVRWIAEELGASFISIPTDKEWGITGSLLKDFNQPVYRFIPGKTKGEGLFVTVLRKERSTPLMAEKRSFSESLNILPMDFLHSIEESIQAPHVELSYSQAIRYLSREALVLPPDIPKGIVVVTYRSHPIGLVKNIGNRANNLYPKEWRIRSSHLPDTQPVII